MLGVGIVATERIVECFQMVAMRRLERNFAGSLE